MFAIILLIGGKKTNLYPRSITERGFSVVALFYCIVSFLAFIVNAKITVTTALAVQEKNALSHTPFKSHVGVRINKKPIGNTSVPKNEVISERAGLSSAVK